ncbi:MAG: CerR family C-terminal domain-containing protein [Bauldia sp.]
MAAPSAARIKKSAGPPRPTNAGKASPRRRRAETSDRGAETRARLIAAALDVFGHKGFEGASTREIATSAGANLAAIVYHFGGKEELYRAVAEYVVAGIIARVASGLGLPTAAGHEVGTGLAAFAARAQGLDPAAAIALLTQVIGTFVDVIVTVEEGAAWARFLVREQLDPTSAFDVIYGFMGPAHGLICRLVGMALGKDPESLEVKIRAFSILGQGLVFRVAQSLVLRRLGVARLGATEASELKRVLALQVRAILEPGVQP